MDAASYAAQSDPDCNRHFRRRWIEHPVPQIRQPAYSPKSLDDVALETLLAWRREAPRRNT
jgi:hypothetical protein